MLMHGSPLLLPHSVLIIKPKWLALILEGIKTLEIRGTATTKVGQVIYLAASGDARLVASCRVTACHGPLGRDEWVSLRPAHCVPDAARPYRQTHAWEFSDVQRLLPPVPYVRKCGVVTWERLSPKLLMHSSV
jgi:hypothetical protein